MKTHDLSPKHNYIIAFHPHGIFSYGAFANFATEGTGFSRIFPSITPSLATLEGIFWIPFVRDYVMSMGEYKSFHSLKYLKAPVPINSDSHSLLEEDFVKNESRTHWAGIRSKWPSIRFRARSGMQSPVGQQKLQGFVRPSRILFIGGTRRLNSGSKPKQNAEHESQVLDRTAGKIGLDLPDSFLGCRLLLLDRYLYGSSHPRLL